MSDKLGHATRFTFIGRKQVERNADPQRRCYNGVHYSSEMVWTDWVDFSNPKTEEAGRDVLKAFQTANPSHEYRLLNPGEYL